jgi:hypothetical protein
MVDGGQAECGMGRFTKPVERKKERTRALFLASRAQTCAAVLGSWSLFDY